MDHKHKKKLPRNIYLNKYSKHLATPQYKNNWNYDNCYTMASIFAILYHRNSSSACHQSKFAND